MCLAQGHNAVPPARLKPVALRSGAKHSRYHYVTASLLNSSGDLYQSVHRALNLLSL